MRKIIGFILHRNFEKSYAKLDENIKTAFRERRNLLLMDPDHPILSRHSLRGKWLGCHSINITGDYRAVFKMEGYIVIFIEIGRHGQLYK
jgi:addiction module RelE/StbE family toxin